MNRWQLSWAQGFSQHSSAYFRDAASIVPCQIALLITRAGGLQAFLAPRAPESRAPRACLACPAQPEPRAPRAFLAPATAHWWSHGRHGRVWRFWRSRSHGRNWCDKSHCLSFLQAFLAHGRRSVDAWVPKSGALGARAPRACLALGTGEPILLCPSCDAMPKRMALGLC